MHAHELWKTLGLLQSQNDAPLYEEHIKGVTDLPSAGMREKDRGGTTASSALLFSMPIIVGDNVALSWYIE